MEEEFVPYQEALALKELGFDEPCLKFYPTEEKLVPGINVKDGDTNSELNQYNKLFVSAPLYQQAFRWLYQKLGIEKNVMILDTESQKLFLKKLINIVKNGN